MRKLNPIGFVLLVALAGCGLENFFSNSGHTPFPRPASAITGTAYDGVAAGQIQVLDGDGNALTADKGPFYLVAGGSPPTYELRLPSSTYAFLRVQARAGNPALQSAGNTVWRSLVPSVGAESKVSAVDFDAANVTETLIVEAWLSGNGKKFKQLNPPAYVGDGVTTGTRTQIRKDMGTAGTPAQKLLGMVQQILTRNDSSSTAVDPDFFFVPVLNSDWTTRSSALGNGGFLALNPLDYDQDGIKENNSAKFDAQLAAVAQLYQPDGCSDPTMVRVLFTVDFRPGGLDGNCATVDRFKWTVDKPGKQMYFVGWIHADSPIQDPQWGKPLGNGVPNTVPMHDDGTNGDEVANDNIWTLTVDLPRNLRIGYKYTWGTQGQPWSGSEEWPGNSRLLEVFDQNGDNFVYRRDVYGDEATNKDKMNLNGSLVGNVITWTTDLHGGQCGGPEVHEQEFVDGSMCACATTWHTPNSVGPLTVACPAP
jgi:hypothetical protein